MKKSLAINKILERLQSRVTDKTPTSQLNMINHARRVLRGLESLESIADNPSPSATRDAHYLKVSQSAKRLQSEFAKIRDQLYDILVSEDSSKEERLNHLLKPTEHAAELRLVLRQMPLDERNKFILSAVSGRQHRIALSRS
nr:hypothetical protein [Nitrosomonas nitrosa]